MSMSVQKKDISLSTFTHNYAYGSQQGNDFGCVGWLESPVTRIVLSLGQSAFGRLVFEKSDGMNITVGATDQSDKCIWTFKEGEKFSEIKLYTSGGKLVCVCIKTNYQTCRAEVKGFNGMSPIEHPIDVGSGVCVGVYGNSEVWLESLGFAMLKNEALGRLRIGGGAGKSAGGSQMGSRKGKK